MRAKSLRTAINDKCRECIVDPRVPGTWLAQVEACTSYTCPLWVVRPIRKEKGPDRWVSNHWGIPS